MEEINAITLLKQGNLRGWEPLVNLYYLQAMRSAYLIVRDKAQAEDIVQTFFLELPRKITKFDDTLRFRPWLLKCVVNASITSLAGTTRFVSLDNDINGEDDFVDLLFDLQPLPEEQVIAEEIRQRVWDTLGKLTPNQRAVVVMRYYLQFDETEMAQKLKKPKSSIKWWLRSAKASLRKLLHPIETTKAIEIDQQMEMQKNSKEIIYE